MRSESRTEETSGLVTTVPRRRRSSIARVAPFRYPAAIADDELRTPAPPCRHPDAGASLSRVCDAGGMNRFGLLVLDQRLADVSLALDDIDESHTPRSAFRND